MIRIVLVCAAGMSTSILVNNMKKSADPKDEINACPLSELENVIDDVDIVLVGPQVRFQMASIDALAKAHGKKAALMDQKAYGMLDGAKMLKQAWELHQQKN